jgi:hypothetical protein
MAWDLDKILKLIAICGAAVTFMWGLFQYFDGREREADVRRIEAMKPFLDRQLELYTEATQVTAAIAVSTDTAERTLALQRFWRLYYGELALVEDRSKLPWLYSGARCKSRVIPVSSSSSPCNWRARAASRLQHHGGWPRGGTLIPSQRKLAGNCRSTTSARLTLPPAVCAAI